MGQGPAAGRHRTGAPGRAGGKRLAAGRATEGYGRTESGGSSAAERKEGQAATCREQPRAAAAARGCPHGSEATDEGSGESCARPAGGGPERGSAGSGAGGQAAGGTLLPGIPGVEGSGKVTRESESDSSLSFFFFFSPFFFFLIRKDPFEKEATAAVC